MAKMTAAERKRLPDSVFAYPSKRLYPIHTPGHRQAALREASRPSTRGTRSHVQKRINQRLGRKGKTGPGPLKSTSTRRTAPRRRAKRSR